MVPRLAVKLIRRHVQLAIVPIVSSRYESKPYIRNGLAFVTPGTHSDTHISGKTERIAREDSLVSAGLARWNQGNRGGVGTPPPYVRGVRCGALSRWGREGGDAVESHFGHEKRLATRNANRNAA